MGTHQESYRPWTGPRQGSGLRFWPLSVAGVHVALKRKLPLALLFVMPVAAMFIFSFLVYSKYAVQDGSFARATGLRGMGGALVGVAASTLEVKQLIAQFNLWSRLFALLIITWYGAGLVADDRRCQASLLYFSRPITRLDYVLGKLCTLLFFGLLAVLVPGLVICLVAVFSSPDWIFLTEESGTILATLGYGTLWVGVFSLLVLAVSSLATRKSFALVGVFAATFVPNVMMEILRTLLNDGQVRVFSPWMSFRRIAEELFAVRMRVYDWPVSWSYAVVASLAVLSALVLTLRLRRLEVVG